MLLKDVKTTKELNKRLVQHLEMFINKEMIL